MAINEETRQLEIAREVESLTRTLAHSTRTVPNPNESYELLAELGLIVDHLRQVSQQLAQWHRSVVDGTHYNGLDGEKYAPENVALFLFGAVNAFGEASGALADAHSANSGVRWLNEVKEIEEAQLGEQNGSSSGLQTT